MNTSAEQRLSELGIKLPAPPKPLGAYVPAVQVGKLLFLSGTLPLEGGVPKFLGRIGAEVEHRRWTERRAIGGAQCAGLGGQHLGSLDQVTRSFV